MNVPPAPLAPSPFPPTLPTAPPTLNPTTAAPTRVPGGPRGFAANRSGPPTTAAAAANPAVQAAQLAAKAADVYGAVEKDHVHRWIDIVFMPTVLAQNNKGFDIQLALNDLKRAATKLNDNSSYLATKAVEDRLRRVGYPYFRLHPKGRGMVCLRKGGIPPFSLVEEYLGAPSAPALA